MSGLIFFKSLEQHSLVEIPHSRSRLPCAINWNMHGRSLYLGNTLTIDKCLFKIKKHPDNFVVLFYNRKITEFLLL